MRVIPPLPITDTRFTSSTVAEPYAPAAYAGGTTYAFDDIVSVVADFTIYKSLQSSNTGNTPNVSPTWWEVVGPTETAYQGTVTLTGVVITGTAGQFSCTASSLPLAVGQYVVISGVYGGTGSITGYANPTTYKISATNGSTTFTLTTTADAAIVTTAGTPTGLTYIDHTIYALGATASANHRVYESLAAQTVSNPLPVWPATTTAYWMDVGPTNKWAMLDTLRNTRTIKPSTMTVVVTPGIRVDSFAVMGMRNVNTLHITSVSGATTVYDYTAALSTRTITDWYTYFFSAFTNKASEVHFDLPPYSNAVITLVLTSTSGNVECGAFVIGSQVYIGATQYNTVSDYVNFSTVTRDFAGKVNTMTQRPGVPKTSQQIQVPKAIAQLVKDTIMALDATPAVWSGIDDETNDWFEPILILGFVTGAPINIAYPEHAVLTLDLMEV